MVEFGPQEEPWNLSVLLNYDADAADNVQSAPLAAAHGAILERLPLIVRLHDEMISDLAAGGSRATARNRFRQLKNFFAWARTVDQPLRIDTAEHAVVSWSEYLLIRARNDEIKETSAHSSVTVVSTLLDRILGRNYPLIKHTRLKKIDAGGRFHKSAGDKLRMSETMAFGSAVVELCSRLDTVTIRSPLPVKVVVKNHELEFWAGLQKPNSRKRTSIKRAHEARISQEKRLAASTNISIEARAAMLNIRIEAELLIFIAQTGMNLEQAFRLELEDFRYKSHLDGYQVKAYKARRAGEVLFEIFSEYRIHFERYLHWRSEWFRESKNNLVFPFVMEGGNPQNAPQFRRLRKVCELIGVSFISPRSLRKVRINWLLREMSDPSLVASIAQHDIRTLMRVYAEPNPQLAIAEITKFHQKTELVFVPPAAGACVSATPSAELQAPTGAASPDCVNPAGCLFCANHRDLDSGDYVWSLASYRHLKSLELASYRRPDVESAQSQIHPAELVIDRITEKLRSFELSSDARRGWVQEALLRVDEGDYHALWDGFINISEVGEEAG